MIRSYFLPVIAPIALSSSLLLAQVAPTQNPSANEASDNASAQEASEVLNQAFKVSIKTQSKDLALQLTHDQKQLSVQSIKFATEDAQKVLLISIDDLQVQRSWQKLIHPAIQRALLYPSKKNANRAYLKIRFNRALPSNILSLIESKSSEKGIEILVPSTASIPMVSTQNMANTDTNANVNLNVDQNKDSENSNIALNAVSTELSNEGATDAQGQGVIEVVAPSLNPRQNGQQGTNNDLSVGDQLPHPEKVFEMYQHLGHELLAELKAQPLAPAVLVLPTLTDVDDRIPRGISLLNQGILHEVMSKEAHLIWMDDRKMTQYAHNLHRDQSEDYSKDEIQKLSKISGADLAYQSKLYLKSPTQLILESKLYNVKDGQIIYQENHPLSYQQMKNKENEFIDSPTKFGAFWRSFLLPGTGQIYGGQSGKGSVFLGAGIGLLAGFAASTVAGYLAEKDYNTFEAQYAHRRADANAHYDRANLLAATYGALWLSSLIDAYFSTTEETTVDHQALFHEFNK